MCDWAWSQLEIRKRLATLPYVLPDQMATVEESFS